MIASALLARISPFAFVPSPASPRGRPAPLETARPRMLPRGAVVTLADRRLQLRVVRGSVWITRDGCPADTVLGAGGVYEQRPGARVLLQALDDAQLLIAEAGARDHNA